MLARNRKYQLADDDVLLLLINVKNVCTGDTDTVTVTILKLILEELENKN